MATVAHVIRSSYDPADRERLERETGQHIDDLWQTESSSSTLRRTRAAPSFVPATISYDEWGAPLQPTAASEKPPKQPSTSSAEWYRCLRLTTSSTTTPSESPPPSPLRPSSAPSPSTLDRANERHPQLPPKERITKNDWFIRKALISEPSTKPNSPAPSLADLLARDPPPLPSEDRYNPPVWLHIGPSNRGFGMLQRSGWREGEGLGAHVARVGARGVEERRQRSPAVRKSDVRTTPEVIDLTLSDSEGPEDEEDVVQGFIPSLPTSNEASESHSMQKSLLTPLPTVLKADRLGIGLKAKTEGPYKQSKKRVTHGAAALAAHISSAEEMRRRKATLGKGRRGFARVHKREEDGRKTMLAYFQRMNKSGLLPT